MRKIISLLFVVISFQIFGATSGTENKEFDYQENFSQFVGFFSEAKDVGENEEENQPKVSFVGQSITAAGNAGSTLLKIDLNNSNNNALYVQVFDLKDYKIVLSENNKRKKYNIHFYIVFCNYRL
jgi:hypothetical protein